MTTPVYTPGPKRIQRKRTKGWRLGDAVYVGRPSVWGNPWWAGVDGTAVTVVNRYREVWGRFSPRYVAGLLAPLRGHDLACWCPLDQPCHADVLLELANS
jgi:hypothetical protein